VLEITARTASPGIGIEGCDLSDSRMLATLLKNIRPDGIFHCVGSFSNSWEADLETNVRSRSLLETLRATGLRSRVLLIGSAAEYGFASGGPVSGELPAPSGLDLRPDQVDADSSHGLLLPPARNGCCDGEDVQPLWRRLLTSAFPGRVLQQVSQIRDGLKKKIEVRSLDSSRDYLDVRDAAAAYSQDHEARIGR